MQAAYSTPADGELTHSEPFIQYLEAIGPIGAEFAQPTTESAAADVFRTAGNIQTAP